MPLPIVLDISVGQAPFQYDGSPSPPGGGGGATLMPASDFNMFPLPIRPGEKASSAAGYHSYGGGGHGHGHQASPQQHHHHHASSSGGDAITLDDCLEAMPFPLDSQYRATITRRANRVRHIMQTLDECGLEGAELQRLKAEIDAKFKGWIMGGGDNTPGRGAMELSDLNHLKL